MPARRLASTSKSPPTIEYQFNAKYVLIRACVATLVVRGLLLRTVPTPTRLASDFASERLLPSGYVTMVQAAVSVSILLLLVAKAIANLQPADDLRVLRGHMIAEQRRAEGRAYVRRGREVLDRDRNTVQGLELRALLHRALRLARPDERLLGGDGAERVDRGIDLLDRR